MGTLANSEDPDKKCCIIWHFIRVYTVCKNNPQEQKLGNAYDWEMPTCDPLKYIMDNPIKEFSNILHDNHASCFVLLPFFLKH